MIERKFESSLKEWSGTNYVTDPTWGDNGKGKVVDMMAQRADMVVRINGGANAGHTVINEHGEFKLHLMPSGIFNPEAICVLSDTVVVNPFILVDEINALSAAGIEVTDKNLLISRNAHLVMPWHRTRDGLRETARGSEKIGTTGQGIGPTYADRSERVGLRVQDLMSSNFEAMFDRELMWQEQLGQLMSNNANGGIMYDRDQIYRKMIEAREVLAPMISNVLPVIWNYQDQGRRILGEAGQGVLLDLDRGGYPDVTSSHPGIAGFNLATGLHPREVERVIAVTKAYTTRVGEGPLPTELHDEMGNYIRAKGHEYGATTGRPRRCGWLDMPAVRYGIRVGGVDSLALTKMDIFDALDEVNICVGYEVDGAVYPISPTADVSFMREAKPVYEVLPGWRSETSSIRDFRDLPENAQRLVKRVEELAGVPVELVSVGAQRQESIYR